MSKGAFRDLQKSKIKKGNQGKEKSLTLGNCCVLCFYIICIETKPCIERSSKAYKEK